MKWRRIGAVGSVLAGLLVAATCVIGGQTALAGAGWVTTQLTTGPEHTEPQLSGNRAVWLTYDGSNTQVFTQRIGVDADPSQLTTDANNHESPQVSGDRVVWRATVGANEQIFTQHIGDAHPSQLTTDANDHYWPQVSGDRVVWTGRDNGHYQVFTLKVGVDTSATQLTTDAHEHTAPQVDVDRVVWEGTDDELHREIFTQNVAFDTVATQLTTDTNDHYRPNVSGDRVVWLGWLGGYPQVFTELVAPGSTPSQITTDANDHEYASVSGDRIVWQGWADYHPQVFTQKIGVDASPIEVTSDRQHYHQPPHVSGDRVVWSAQTTAVPEPIYQVFTRDMGVDASPVQITFGSSQQQWPLVSGNRILWSSYEGNHYQISTAALGCRLHYAADAHGSVVGASTQVVAYDGSCTPVTAVPAAGYHFASWSDDSTANPRTDVHVTADATRTATFAANPVISTKLKLSGLASVKVKKSYKVSGTITPGAAAGSVKVVWKRYYSRAYRTVKTTYATIAGGKFSSSYKPTTRGKWRAYVSYAGQFAATVTYQASATVYKAFTVK
jgi:beta propeller repeat protein